jgi:hypothetical protein
MAAAVISLTIPCYAMLDHRDQDMRRGGLESSLTNSGADPSLQRIGSGIGVVDV